jgi:hypothetical protein
VPPAPGLPVTKLAVLQKAAAQAIALFNVRSNLGVWEFNANLNGKADYRSLLPSRPLGAPVAGHTQREAVIAAVGAPRPHGGTGLYDTIEASATSTAAASAGRARRSGPAARDSARVLAVQELSPAVGPRMR